jgi:acrylyl-CoA reductase (NADPH)
MGDDTFPAFVLRQDGDRTAVSREEVSLEDLPEGEVLVDVAFSSLNYKDGLALTGAAPIVRSWPMIPGIDLAGTVLESSVDAYRPGDAVIATGWGLGEAHWGGYGRRARLPADWLVPMPEGLDAQHAMALGTAGLTAALCVIALEDGGLRAGDGPVLVTGAAGGVGSVAVALLASRGFRVAALPGGDDDEVREHVETLGAAELVHGEEWGEKPRPLDRQNWIGAVDTVGTNVLARVLSQVRYGGTVSACGLAGAPTFPRP